ncbi:hypothetical protein [Eisenbergiella sp.]
MIKKQITSILLTVALCILTASALTGCAANGKNDASGVQEGPLSSQGQSESPAAGSTAAADAGNTADGKASTGTGASSDNNSSTETVPGTSPSSDAAEAALEGREGGTDAKVIESQTFSGVSLGGYENVQFTTREITENGRSRVEYSLVSDGDAVYIFPDAYDYWQFASEVNFIAFRDVNGDGQKDVITSEQYITGAGAEGAVPFSMTRIYLNQGSEFLFAEGLSVSIGNSLDASRSEEYTVENILAILEEPVYCNFGGTGWTRGEIESFAFLVKNDVLNDNREALSQKINYPLPLVRNGEQLQISSPEEFLASYDDILNLQVIYDVEGAETEDLFWNQDGVMLGTGAIWFGKMQDGSIKIYAIPAEVQYCNPLDVD